MDINYEAQIKNAKERDFCEAVIRALDQSQTQANQVTFARKTRSYGASVSSLYRARKSRNGRTKEIWINLGTISNTTLTRNAKCEFDPDFTLIPKIVAYAESPRLTAWFNK